MLRAVLSSFRAAAIFFVLLVNLAFWGLLFLVVMIPMIVPVAVWRRAVRRRLQGIVELWAGGNNLITDLFLDTRWEISCSTPLRPDGNYLVIANHQSWLDVIAIYRAMAGRISFLGFFVKQQIIWVPIVGIACRALGFPFMRRHSKETLAKHPELRGQDLETTRRALQTFGRDPESILNFMEGTRFSETKRESQQSPYRHLLKPKSGGVAFVLGSVGEKLDAILDVTLVYPRGGRPFDHFIRGNLEWIAVHIESRPIPLQFKTDATFQERSLREEFRQWVRDVWQAKDERIAAILADHGVDAASANEAA